MAAYLRKITCGNGLWQARSAVIRHHTYTAGEKQRQIIAPLASASDELYPQVLQPVPKFRGPQIPIEQNL